jgi:hypothetical protein
VAAELDKALECDLLIVAVVDASWEKTSGNWRIARYAPAIS